MPWLKKSSTPYHALLELQYKEHEIKGLVVCNSCADSAILYLLNGLALRYQQTVRPRKLQQMLIGPQNIHQKLHKYRN